MSQNFNEGTLQRKPLLPLFCFMAIFMMGANFAHPVTPTYIIERGLDSSMQGLAYAATMFTMFLVAPFWGQLCNYVPTKKIVLISGIGYGFGQFLFLMAYSNFMMVFARLFAGCFSSATFVAVTNYIINTTKDPAERGKGLTIFATIQTVVSAIGFFIAGMLGLISTETPLTIQIFLLAGGGIGMMLCMTDDTPFKKAPEKKLAVADVNPLAAFLQAKNFLTTKLVFILAIYAIGFMGQSITEQSFNFFIKSHFDLPSSYNGTIKAVIAIGGFLVNSLITMKIVKNAKLNRVAFPVQFLMFVPYALMLVFKDFYPLVGCYVFNNLMITVRTPVLQNLCAGNAKAGTSNTLMGFYQSIGYLGACIGGLITGAALKGGEMLPFILAAATMTVSVLVAGVFHAKYSKDEK